MAVVREGLIITVMPVVGKHQVHVWFKNHILNFRYMYKQICRLPITRPPKEHDEDNQTLPPSTLDTQVYPHTLELELAQAWGVSLEV